MCREEQERMTERRAVNRVQAICIVRPIDTVRIGACRRWPDGWVQEPADEDEAEETVCVATAPAEGGQFSPLYVPWKFV